MRSLDFFGLTRALQDRFIESSRGAAVPVPLSVVPKVDGRSTKFGLLALGGLLVWFGLVALGFGQLGSALALGGPVSIVAHAAVGSLVVYAGVRAYLAGWEVQRAPYRSGFYLFPAGLIDADRKGFRDVVASEFRSISVEGTFLAVDAGNGIAVRFPFASPERAAEAHALVLRTGEKWAQLGDADALERARLHPLFESGIPNPLAPTRPHVRPVLLSPVACLVLSVLVGSPLGFGVFVVRGEMSERALYRAALQADTIDAYHAYLARGGKRSEVRELFLPRAELKRAIQTGGVEAIEGFIEKHPNTKIEDEVRAVHRAALLVELEKAKGSGLPAIEGLKARYPAHTLIAAELAAARSEAFEKALGVYRSLAPEGRADVVDAVRALLAYAEKRGPGIRIRWVHEFPQSRDMLDSIVSKSEKYYLGRKCLPTQYFLGERAAARQRMLSEKLIVRFASTFPPDVLSFELASVAAEENQKLEPVEGPTLTLLHSESLSGGFVGGRPKTMILGATIVMTATLEVPGHPPLKFRWQAWRAPNFAELDGKDIPDIYEAMVGGAFEEFGRAYLATWFREP